jgi:arylsulfatase
MATSKPNILILWGDDIGTWNISYFSRGMMGYRTPNIDRVANEGVAFTDFYGQQSCTAGRAAFICGQNPLRTGLTKVGMPGATVGLQAEDPTIAELLKTTSAIGMSICRPCTDLTSFSAISITSTRRKSRNCPTIPRIRHS